MASKVANGEVGRDPVHSTAERFQQSGKQRILIMAAGAGRVAATVGRPSAGKVANREEKHPRLIQATIASPNKWKAEPI